jgi:ribosomal protein S18 acetylase RimI-like enzyme
MKGILCRNIHSWLSVVLIVWCHIIVCKALSQPTKHFRLQKTIESDLPTVCSLLASTSLKPIESRGIFDWAQNIEFLRVKESFHKQLLSRFRVMNQGHAVMKNTKRDSNVSTPMDLCRLLFSNDSFRWALEGAGNCATETNAWTNHNFALTPEPYLLQHLMLSAYKDEKLVGFCEVAMLPSPKDENSNQSYYPCIVNLVVDPMNRNQGLATRMIRTSLRFIQKHWIHRSEITLYVEKSNLIALRLYEKENFILKQELHDKFYLTKILQVEQHGSMNPMQMLKEGKVYSRPSDR